MNLYRQVKKCSKVLYQLTNGKNIRPTTSIQWLFNTEFFIEFILQIIEIIEENCVISDDVCAYCGVNVDIIPHVFMICSEILLL